MAANLSNYLERKLLDHCLGVAAYTFPSTIYLALYTSDPTEADTGTEATGGDYARVAITFDAASTNTSSVTSTQNAAAVVFARASAAWGTITHWGLRDALTVGNLLWFGALDASVVVANLTTVEVEDGALDITID